MLKIFKTNEKNLEEATLEDEKIWISLINPTDAEINSIKTKFNIEDDFITAPLDQEEVSRLEIAQDHVLILINAPFEAEYEKNKMTYETTPVGIIVKDNVIITVALRDLPILRKIEKLRKNDANINKPTKFIFQIIYNITIQYLNYLRQIDKITDHIEASLTENTENEYLLQLLTLEKNLVYFITALKSNEQVLNKILRLKALPIYEEDEELFDDVIIELKQAQEMSSINSIIIRSIRDAFASIISNNLNRVMKILASCTIILTIPTMVFSFFGMNTKMGIVFQAPYSTVVILIVCIIISTILYIIMRKKNMF